MFLVIKAALFGLLGWLISTGKKQERRIVLKAAKSASDGLLRAPSPWEVAKRLGASFDPAAGRAQKEPLACPLFWNGQARPRNELRGALPGFKEYACFEYGGMWVAAFHLDRQLPVFQVVPAAAGPVVGAPPITLEGDLDFQRRFVIRSGDEFNTLSLLASDPLRRALSADPVWSAEGAGQWLVLYETRVPEVGELESALRRAAAIAAHFRSPEEAAARGPAALPAPAPAPAAAAGPRPPGRSEVVFNGNLAFALLAGALWCLADRFGSAMEPQLRAVGPIWAAALLAGLWFRPRWNPAHEMDALTGGACAALPICLVPLGLAVFVAVATFPFMALGFHQRIFAAVEFGAMVAGGSTVCGAIGGLISYLGRARSL